MYIITDANGNDIMGRIDIVTDVGIIFFAWPWIGNGIHHVGRSIWDGSRLVVANRAGHVADGKSGRFVDPNAPLIYTFTT